MSQIAFPTPVSPHEIARERTLGDAIKLCAKVGGKEPKDVQGELKTDKAQWSRWESGQEGIVWPKFVALMDYCGNDAPLLWMLHARGYDLSSLRKQESETEKLLRIEREARAKAEEKVRLLTEVISGRPVPQLEAA